MHSRLVLRFEYDDDGTGELFAEVHHGKFGGISSAWFGVGELRAFGQALQDQFPLQPDKPIVLQGGIWASTGEARLEEVHLGLRVSAVGGTGTIGIRVELASQHQTELRFESRCSVTVALQTNYESLRTFGHRIVGIANSNTEQATLVASE
jgi:hypothetical protein